MAVFHTPDGGLLSVETTHITALRPASSGIKEHVAPGTNTILYVGAKTWGITETIEQAKEAVRDCVDDGEK